MRELKHYTNMMSGILNRPIVQSDIKQIKDISFGGVFSSLSDELHRVSGNIIYIGTIKASSSMANTLKLLDSEGAIIHQSDISALGSVGLKNCFFSSIDNAANPLDVEFIGIRIELVDSVGKCYIPTDFSTYVSTHFFRFDGIDEYMKGSNFNFSNSLTVSCEMETTDFTSSIGAVVAQDDTSSGRRCFHIAWRGSRGQLLIAVFHPSNGATSLYTTVGAISSGVRHNIVLSFDGTTNFNGFKVFIDGVLNVQTTALEAGIKDYLGIKFSIGSIASGNGWLFDGIVDNVIVWDDDKSSNILDIYNKDIAALLPKRWYNFETATFSTNWTCPDSGSDNEPLISFNMESGDRLSLL